MNDLLNFKKREAKFCGETYKILRQEVLYIKRLKAEIDNSPNPNINAILNQLEQRIIDFEKIDLSGELEPMSPEEFISFLVKKSKHDKE